MMVSFDSSILGLMFAKTSSRLHSKSAAFDMFLRSQEAVQWARVINTADSEIQMTFVHFLGDIFYMLSDQDSSKRTKPITEEEFNIPAPKALQEGLGNDDPCYLAKHLVSVMDTATGGFIRLLFRIATKSSGQRAPVIKLFHALSTLPQQYGLRLLKNEAGLVEWVTNLDDATMHDEIRSISANIKQVA